MTTENTTNVETTTSTTVAAAVEKKSRLRPAVQSRLGQVLAAVKTVLEDGKPRGVSEITRGCEALGLVGMSTWTDVQTVLKKHDDIFGTCFVEGAKRQRYFMPTAPVTQPVQEPAPAAELNDIAAAAEAAFAEPVVEEAAPVQEEAPAAKPKKGKAKKAAPVQETEEKLAA